MKRDPFIRLLKSMHKAEIDLHIDKGDQYASEADTLQNFYDGAAALGMTPRSYCLALLEKHRQALLLNAKGESSESPAVIMERVSDIRLYMALYMGLTLDQIIQDPGAAIEAQDLMGEDLVIEDLSPDDVFDRG